MAKKKVPKLRELSESCRSPSNRGNSAFLGFSQEQNRTKKQVKGLKEHRASGNLSKCPIDGWLQGPEKVSAPLHILFPDFCLGSPFLLSSIFPLFLESLKMCKCWSTLRQWDLVLIRPSFCNYKKICPLKNASGAHHWKPMQSLLPNKN